MTQSDIELNRLASIPSAPSARGEGIAPPSCSDLSSTRSVTIKTNGPHPAAKLLAPMFASLWHWVRRHRFAVLSTAAIGSLITTVLGVAWLVPTWQSQDSAREAFELDQWTALKDFLEQCWERASQGRQVAGDCDGAEDIALPPPPHLDIHKETASIVQRIPNLRARGINLEPSLYTDTPQLSALNTIGLMAAYMALVLIGTRVLRFTYHGLRRVMLRAPKMARMTEVTGFTRLSPGEIAAPVTVEDLVVEESSENPSPVSVDIRQRTTQKAAQATSKHPGDIEFDLKLTSSWLTLPDLFDSVSKGSSELSKKGSWKASPASRDLPESQTRLRRVGREAAYAAHEADRSDNDCGGNAYSTTDLFSSSEHLIEHREAQEEEDSTQLAAWLQRWKAGAFPPRGKLRDDRTGGIRAWQTLLQRHERERRQARRNRASDDYMNRLDERQAEERRAWEGYREGYRERRREKEDIAQMRDTAGDRLFLRLRKSVKSNRDALYSV